MAILLLKRIWRQFEANQWLMLGHYFLGPRKRSFNEQTPEKCDPDFTLDAMTQSKEEKLPLRTKYSNLCLVSVEQPGKHSKLTVCKSPSPAFPTTLLACGIPAHNSSCSLNRSLLLPTVPMCCGSF